LPVDDRAHLMDLLLNSVMDEVTATKQSKKDGKIVRLVV
jgi:hypothetical protein